MKFSQHFGLFVRSFFLQTGWNYLKYQNLGLMFVMWPFVEKLYKQDKDAIPSVVSRYLATFNTQPVMASFCFWIFRLSANDRHSPLIAAKFC